MEAFTNSDLLPLEVSDSPWLFENNNKGLKSVDTGKWMLFYDKSLMNEAWDIAKILYRENKIDGVKSMKCSTLFKNPRASTLDEGIIILFCNNSSNEETIMNIGRKIIDKFVYKEKPIIYYKTDLQTREGTFATGSKKNHTYKLVNPLYEGKCLIELNSSKEQRTIERSYPIKRQEKPYPLRYDSSVFERFNKMNTPKLQNDFKKWKDGINYKTNRKITIGGKIHKELKQMFVINYGFDSVLFEDLNDINSDEYLQETIKINNDVDIENDVIKKYNVVVDHIIEKIQKLERWHDYIEFEGKCYGITRTNEVLNNVHIENDCLGEMVFIRKKTDYTFNDRPFCNYADKETIYSIYKCSKCNYEKKMIEGNTGGDSQKLGFGGNSKNT